MIVNCYNVQMRRGFGLDGTLNSPRPKDTRHCGIVVYNFSASCKKQSLGWTLGL